MHLHHRQTDGHWHRSISAMYILHLALKIVIIIYIIKITQFDFLSVSRATITRSAIVRTKHDTQSHNNNCNNKIIIIITAHSSPLPLSHWALLTRLVVILCPNLVVASFPLSQTMTERPTFCLSNSVLIRRFNAILLQDTFVTEEKK